MNAIKEHCENLWRWKCGLPEKQVRTWEEMRKSEWSDEFEELMRNRLAMGGLHYCPMREQDTKDERFNVDEIVKRIGKYMNDGDTEHLVDVANFALCEWVRRNEMGGGKEIEHDTPQHRENVHGSDKLSGETISGVSEE